MEIPQAIFLYDENNAAIHIITFGGANKSGLAAKTIEGIARDILRLPDALISFDQKQNTHYLPVSIHCSRDKILITLRHGARLAKSKNRGENDSFERIEALVR